ncbi:CNH domain-containing protein [Mycotypha africana]|uniref:CNH domain-containing protein n=1 Tax=Mycotypha africana TaxID=64632 RepID=UPI002301F943|nr:CNH domain-containing protein [Mycotypha africana]KAI8973277.1 CNH domain-containing protein [Mycotypha africana]
MYKPTTDQQHDVYDSRNTENFVKKSLNGLMQDVNSYISELNEEQHHSDRQQYSPQLENHHNDSTSFGYMDTNTFTPYPLPMPHVDPQRQYQHQLSPGYHIRSSSSSSVNHEKHHSVNSSTDYLTSSNKYSDDINLPMPEPYHPYSSLNYHSQSKQKLTYPPMNTSATIIEPSIAMPTPDHYYNNKNTGLHDQSPLQLQQNHSQYQTIPPLDYVDTYIKKQQQEKINIYDLEEICDERSNFSTINPGFALSRLKHFSSNTSSSNSIASSVHAQSNSYAFLSNLSKAFVKRIQGLEHVRELFCANEYPESFTGQEAITILNSLLDGIRESYCVSIANALMHAKPSLFEPIHYSQKSIIQDRLFNSPDEYYTLHDDVDPLGEGGNIPTGILTNLLDCYTADCLPGKGGCYAPKCPNKPDVFEQEFNQYENTETNTKRLLFSSGQQQEDQSSTAAAIAQQTAWSQRVSKELLQSLTKKEIERQEAINELIYSEYVYKRDLETLAEVIIEPILTKTIIPTAKRDDFVKEVFANYRELIETSNALYQDLLQLQHEHNHECIPTVGDILLKHFAYFEEPFTKYCPRVSLAEYLVKAEERHNPHFGKFIVHTERNKRMRRLAFRHFLLNPVTRVQRYPLLLDAIIKKTEDTHADYLYLAKAIDMVKKVASMSDQLAEIYKRRVGILEINDLITFKQGEFQDLQLTQPQRKLYYQGDLKRRSNGIEVTEKSDIHIFVFDHIVLMTKPRKSTASSHSSSSSTTLQSLPSYQQQLYPQYDEYRVWRRPIPLQLLHVGVTSDYSTSSSTFYSSPNQSSFSGAGAATGTSTPPRNFNLSISTGYVVSGSAFTVPSNSGISSSSSTSHQNGGTATSFHHSHHGSSYLSSSGLTPLTLHHLGQRGGVYTFLCSLDEKQKWLQAFEEAKLSLKKRLGDDVFDLILLDDSSFRYVAATNGTSKHGRVNCTVPFASSNNIQMLAVGTDTGVYLKSFDSPGIKRVLSSETVTQLAVLDKCHILLVLADKTLKAYPLDLIDSSPSNGKTSLEKLGQEIAQHVHFFQVGHCNDKDLVLFKKKKNTSSIFTALEPLYDLRDPKNQKYIGQKPGFKLTNRSNHSWFKKYKEFYVGAESSNVHFLKSKLLIVCERGFEIIDPENLSVGGRDIPDKGDPQFNFVHRNIDSNKPLAMYRVHDKFLLCYNKFAFYVNNRNGSLVQRGPQKPPVLCEWEGNPDHIVYQYPYIVAFDPQFIEIRHVDTGDLVQIIPGDQIRLTNYQTMNDLTIIQGCMTHLSRPDIQTLFCLNLKLQRSNNNPRKHIVE